MSIEIRMQADDFFNAYRVLRESNEAMFDTLKKTRGKLKTVSEVAFGVLPTMGPDVVNLAFSLELYVKDLHFALNGTVPRGHNILKLYTKLPKPIKREIFTHRSISQNPWMTKGPVFLLKRYTGDRNAYHGFLHQIGAISNSFEKWRYSYESKALHYEESFALAFIEAVKSSADMTRTRLAA